MNIKNQQHTIPESPSLDRQIVDYAPLVDTVQLSVARRIGIAQSLTATTFEQLLIHKSESEQQELISQVGQHFDAELVGFVIGTIIHRQRHETIILAEETDGLDGYLPWEEPLHERIALLKKQKGSLVDVTVRVERYATQYATVEDIVMDSEPIHEAPVQQKYDA